MKFLRKINLEINKDLYNPIQVKQNDTARYLLFNLLDNGVPFSLENKTVRVYGLKPDGTKVFNNLTIINAARGLAELQLTTQMLAKSGTLKLELVIYEATDILSTTKFDIDIISCIRDDGAIESTNEFSALTVALAKADEYGEALKQGTENIELIYATELNGVKSSLEEIAISVTSFGAKADGVTNDTEAIKNAYSYAVSNNFTLYFPKGIYRTTESIYFTGGINIVMDGMIQLDSNVKSPCVFYGALKDKQQKGGKAILSARHKPDEGFVSCDWTNIESTAITIQNVVNADITVNEAGYSTVGVMLQANGGANSYNKINLGNISNNKYGVYGRLLQNKNYTIKTYVTQNEINLGRFTKNSNMNPNEDNYGFKFINTKDDYVFDCITGYGQIFELGKPSTSESHKNLCFDLTGCVDFEFKNFRSEKNRGDYLAELTRCCGCVFNGSGFYDSPRKINEIELINYDNLGKTRNVIPYYHKEIEIFNADIRNSFYYEAKSYSNAKKILIKEPLLSVDFSTDTKKILNYTMQNNAETDNRDLLTNNGFRLYSSNPATNFGVRLFPNNHKNFKIKVSGSPRIAFLCYDSQNNYLIPQSNTSLISSYNSEVTQIGSNMVQISNTSDHNKLLEREIDFYITGENIKSVTILLCGNKGVADTSWINSFKIFAVYNDNNYRTNPSIDMGEYINKPFPRMTEKPSIGGRVGEIIYNDSPFKGTDIGWICYKSDNVDGWWSLGNIVGTV